MEKNKDIENPMLGIGTHDFIRRKRRKRKMPTVRRSYEIPKNIDKKIKMMSLGRGGIAEYKIVQEALNQYFEKPERLRVFI